MAGRRLAACAAALILLPAVPAYAQRYLGRAVPHAGSLETGGGIVWSAGYDAGTRSATETPNTTGGAGPFTLFQTDSRLASAVGVAAHAGVYLGPRVSVEGLFQFSRPSLRTNLTTDFEDAAPLEAGEVVSSYLLGGSVLYHFGTGRLVPFVIGGGGYLRQLHEDNAEVLTGTDVHGGAGLKYWFGTAARRVGLRIDAQASARSKSVAFEQKRRILPVLGAGIVYLF